MPELPEVEYVALQLRTALIRRKIVGAEVLWAGAIASPAVPDFVARIAGQRVTGIGRRAKSLLIELSGGDVLVVHRRMTGNLILTSATTDVPYTRVRFALDGGRQLAFSDPRKFGRLWLLRGAELTEFFADLGPEPLDAAFTDEVLAARLAGHRRAIKALLLDQAIVAGLGNIYADEALYQARIHPLRPGAALTAADVAALRAAIQSVLMTGIEHGGTTIGRHRDLYDEAGTNREHLHVYQHTGQPCGRCGTPITRIVVAQRGTHYCPSCQRLA